MEVLLFYLLWIPKIIQSKLIHILGGYTKDEYKIHYIELSKRRYNEGEKCGFKLGIKYLATQLEHIAVQNYGCSKQDWIDKIYSKIQEARKGNVE